MFRNLRGSDLLLALPDDIFSVITTALSPRDVCSLGLSCRELNGVVSSDKVWLAQCDKLGLIPYSILIEWRKGVLSYKALFRFLVNINPLIGVWVHQNPELGNVVYVMPGFLSVVGCRIIPQEVGPLGLKDGPILWTPVFEILCKYDGSTTFFLHGREQGADYVYPGLLKSVNRNCNVLLLEVEAGQQLHGGNMSFDNLSQGIVGQKGTEMSFSHLGFDDRSMLLNVVTSQVRTIVPESANVLLFPRSRNNEVDRQQDFTVLHKRRLLFLQNVSQAGDGDQVIKQILRSSSSANGDQENRCTIDEFLRSGNRVGLSLRAATMELDSYSYREWPNMHESRFALYKLPIGHAKARHDYAGLWAGTFGWPSEDKPRKALFLILISYEEESEGGEKHMIATKILEVLYGRRYCKWVYGFRYPGSKPGSLFVLQNGLLVFIWKESRDVLTLQRVELADLLWRGERMPPLSPISNFAYLTRMYTNVYSGISDS